MSYIRGALARIDAEIRNNNDVLTDPTALKVRFRKPNGEIITHDWPGEDVVKDLTGKFHTEILLDEAGSWEFRWEATGNVQVPGGGVLLVEPSAFDAPSAQPKPTAADIRRWSKVDFDDLDFEIIDDTDRLERPVERANIWLQHTTGRIFALLSIPNAKEPEETDEAFAERVLEAEWLISSMQLAVQMLVEYAVFLAQPEHAETASDFNQIQSFSAGSYSETRRSPNSRTRGLHPWSDLADLLNDLLTDEKRAALLMSEAPGIKTDDEPRWDVGRDIMGPGDMILTPFGTFRYPWDLIR